MHKENVKKSVALFFTGLVFLLLVFANPAGTFACSCIPPGSPAEELEKSDAVFSGKVLSRDDNAPQNSFRNVTLAVDEVWKGVSQKTVTVVTAADSAACGFGFQKGEKYIVYAQYNANNKLVVSLCSITQLLSQAETDVVDLGEGTVVAPDGSETPSVRLHPSPLLTVLIILLEVLLVVVLYHIFYRVIASLWKLR